jgi:hypothetical protein
VALLLAACPGSTTGGDAGGDDGMVTPDGSDDLADPDGDGLCNATEGFRGTDPMNPDSDGDGFSDFVEVAFNYNPMIAAIPNDDEVFELLEEPGALVRVPTAIVIRGSGEDYVGGFESLEARDAFGLLADDYWAGSVALFANPTENTAVVEPDAERFRGVVGTTELNFETTFTFEGGDRFEPCMRAYPFRYQVKRSDGAVLAFEQYLLVVVPPVNTGEWCRPAEPCI